MDAKAKRFEFPLSSHDAKRLVLGVEDEGLAVRYEDRALVFDDPGLCAAVRAWYGRLSTFNRLIREIAKREGRPIKPYKPMDEVNLVLAILVGLRDGGLPAIVHEVIWRQPFPNANHRTATAAIEDELGVHLPEEVLRIAVTPLFTESKRLLDGSDKTLTNEQAKRLHKEVAERLVAAIQSSK